MKIAIMESSLSSGGHEIEYDRILVEELQALGHQVEFYVPDGHKFKFDYHVPIHYLPGSGVIYGDAHGLKKLGLAAKREFNRQRWYKTLYQYALEKRFDALIFPSATHRYLRALKINSLLKAPLPVVFIIHGLTPEEAGYLFAEADKVKHIHNIKIVVQTFGTAHLQQSPDNIHYINPPNYIPRDIDVPQVKTNFDVIKLGFFGQYRKEKRLDPFLDAFVSCKFTRPVKLIVQGATPSEEDAADFERIMKKYGNYKELIEFWHRPLIGKEWQLGLASVDVLVVPYTTPRYRYHTSAMISNAIGLNKPIIIANSINPEVMQKFKIGESFDGDDFKDLQNTIESFINGFDSHADLYYREIARAGEEFSPSKLVKNIISIAGSD